MYYVYAYCDPRYPTQDDLLGLTHQPFYVGLGTGERDIFHLREAKWSSSSNPHKSRTIRKIQNLGLQPIIVRIQDGLSQAEASEKEQHLIEVYGRRFNNTGCLTNISEGGHGGTDQLRTVEALTRRRNGLRNMSDEQKAAINRRLISKQIHIRKTYTLQNPSGDTIVVDDLPSFCNTMGISAQTLYRTVKRRTAPTKGRTAGWRIVNVVERSR